MSKTKKTLTIILAMVMVAALSVAATLAYLTSTTGPVTNTFTVGNVKITLDEAKVTELGVKDGESRVTENSYKLYPSHQYVKDPTVHVDAASDDCWLFVKVVDELAAIEDATTIADQLTANEWTPVEGQTGVYAYKAIVSKGANIPVFESFKIKTDVDNDTLATYAGKTITVTAYAVQADGFTTAAAAWAAAPATWTTSTTTGN